MKNEIPMKRIFFVQLFLLFFLQCYNQNFAFGFDEAGNRYNRTVVLLKSTEQINSEVPPQESFTESLGSSTISIYPNPVEEQLTVEITGGDDETLYLIQLFDLNGRKINSFETKKGLISISFSGLTRGTFILRIVTGLDFSEWKIIKE
jgi:hypothetical protein